MQNLVNDSTILPFYFIFFLLIVTRLGSAWHISSTHIVAPYRSFSREKIPGTIGAYIGLMHVNITLKGKEKMIIQVSSQFTHP